MLLGRIASCPPRHFAKLRCYSLVATRNADEYTAAPEYPAIVDQAPAKKLERKKEATYEDIKTVRTVEEKQIRLNMPRYYGFKCYMLRDDHVPYNNLALTQHVTRTHLIDSPCLPEYYNSVGDFADFAELKAELEESVLFEIDGYQKMHELKKEELDEISLENIVSSAVTKQVNRIIAGRLAKNCPHLVDAHVDFDSRIESFWLAGGMKPPEIVKRYREGQKWQKDNVNEPTNRAMNYVGTALVSLRHDQPLPPVIPYRDCENPALTVPFFAYDPRTVGATTEFRHIANVPGFWSGDLRRFGLLSYHSRGALLKRYYNDTEDDREAVHRQGILSSFAWLNAQANYLGFNTFNDITYPLVTQTVITNGKLWSFYVYQLNTIVCHSKHIRDNPKRNICWGTGELKLYETIENDKLVGFNEDVVKNLVKFYSNVPQERLGVNLTPYLSANEKVSADYEDEEKREWLEREYKYLVSNRPRFKPDYEVFHWEKIYKIDNKTRPMEARRRPFELNIKPFDRRLDERKPPYIPRALRPDLPRHKGRNAKEFFP